MDLGSIYRGKGGPYCANKIHTSWLSLPYYNYDKCLGIPLVFQCETLLVGIDLKFDSYSIVL
jgi:hypothetical protein